MNLAQIKPIVLTLFLFFICDFTMGQFTFRSGYVINNNNDTIPGKIKDNGTNRNTKVCVFRPDNQKKTVKYTPSEIKGFKIPGEKYFISKQFEESGKVHSRFIEVIIEGDVSLYRDWKDKITSYYIQRQGDSLISLTYTIMKAGAENYDRLGYGPELFYEYEGYKTALSNLFKDSKKTSSKIEFLNYHLESIAKLTKNYLREKNDSKSITFQRNINQYKPKLGFFSGVRFNQISYSHLYPTNYTELVEQKFETYPLGMFLLFPLSKFSDYFSLKVEFIANTIKQDIGTKFEENSLAIGIPTLLKYKFLKTRITPTIAGGYAISLVYNNPNSDKFVDSIQKGGVVGEIGVDYKLTNKLTLETNIQARSNINGEKGASPRGPLGLEYKVKSGYTTFNIGIRF